MSNFKGWEIIIILALLLLLFGAKRLPDAARGLGRSLRILKSEVSAMHDDDKDKKVPSETDVTAKAPTPAEGSADRIVIGWM